MARERRFIPMIVIFLLLYADVGCSGKLTRNGARRKIDNMMKAQPTDENRLLKSIGEAPDYGLPAKDFSYNSFDLGRQGVDPDSPDSLENALAQLGYIAIQDSGPGDLTRASVTRHFDATRIVRLTPRMGNVVNKTDHDETYQTGFTCYPEPTPKICDLPDLLEKDRDYQITGIAEEGTHAKVNIVIFWKLSPLALELKRFVEPHKDQAGPLLSESWDTFLSSHSSSGSTRATILFQKFDDGWRIVDEHGRSEKDLN